MTSNTEAIKQYQQKQIRSLMQEQEKFGSFASQFQSLESFRKELKPFYRWRLFNRFVGYRCKTISSGDALDHHITAYFAPMEFKAKSWGGGQNSPVKHIVELDKALKAHNTRFIYVSLPLKLSVYPELVARDSTYFKGASTLPQFRQMTLELLQNNVEVLDFFPIFMQHKSKMRLFAKGHHISPCGAHLVGEVLAKYLKDTTNFTSSQNCAFSKRTIAYPPYNKNIIHKGDSVYLADKSDSALGIFGNCNLQAYENEGAGIAANLAFYLNCEIENLGRKLIFSYLEPFDKQTLAKCHQKKIVLCVSFLSGSFVRTSAVAGMTKKRAIRKILTGSWRSFPKRKWSETKI